MINVITFYNSSLFHKELDDMFLARCEAFTKRLAWVHSTNDREVDQFDTYISSPTYLIATDDNGLYQGSLRLIPMNRPNMLANVFSYIIPDGDIPNLFAIKEISRIHMAQRPDTPRKRGINIYLGELFAGLGEWAKENNCRQMITVVDERMLRVIKLTGAKPTYLHPEGYVQEDGVVCYAIQLHPEDLDRIKQFFDIDEVEMNG